MRYRHDEWDQRFNAERLVVLVELALRQWDQDPRGEAGLLDTALRMARPQAVVLLERAYRSRHRSLAPLIDIDADDLGADYGRYGAAVAALLTLDRSGHLREAGIRWLADCDEVFTLPFLLLRLNDPVDAVRQRAVTAVGARLGAGHAAELVQLLPVIDGLGARRRAGPLVRTITELLVRGDPAGRSALWAGARSHDMAVRECCLRLLATVEPDNAVAHAFDTGDPALREWAAQVATTPGTDPAVQLRLLPLLESDSNPRIRWRALRARASHPDGEPHLYRALLDPDARVRYLARSHLHTRGRTVRAELYRSALTDAAAPETLVGALAGVSDMGTRTDAARIAEFLDHPTVRVRAEAWRALAILDPDTFSARVDQRRADPSGKVRRTCRYLPRP